MIEVTFKIPVAFDKPDENGYIYTEEAIINACKNAKGVPITQLNDKNEYIPIGMANNVWYSDGYIHMEGISWNRGTCEEVTFDELNRVKDMTIIEFSICE